MATGNKKADGWATRRANAKAAGRRENEGASGSNRGKGEYEYAGLGFDKQKGVAYCKVQTVNSSGLCYKSIFALDKATALALLTAAKASHGNINAVVDEFFRFIIAHLRAFANNPALPLAVLGGAPYSEVEECRLVYRLRKTVEDKYRETKAKFNPKDEDVAALTAAMAASFMLDEFRCIGLSWPSDAAKGDRRIMAHEAATRSVHTICEVAAGRDPPVYRPGGMLQRRRGAGAATDAESDVDSIDGAVSDDDDAAPSATDLVATALAALGASPATLPWWMNQPRTAADDAWAQRMEGAEGSPMLPLSAAALARRVVDLATLADGSLVCSRARAMPHMLQVRYPAATRAAIAAGFPDVNDAPFSVPTPTPEHPARRCCIAVGPTVGAAANVDALTVVLDNIGDPDCDDDDPLHPAKLRRALAEVLMYTEATEASAARFTRLLAAWPPEPLHPAEVARHNKFNVTAAAVETWTRGEWTREGGVDGAPLVPNAKRAADLAAAARYWQAQAGWRDGRTWRAPDGVAEQVQQSVPAALAAQYAAEDAARAAAKAARAAAAGGGRRRAA